MFRLQSYSYKYIGEGNAHIVLKINDTNKVLRIFKQDKGNLNFEAAQMAVNFVNTIMIPLLYHPYHKYEVIEISEDEEDEMAELINTLDKVRPKHRKSKFILRSHAVLAPNLLTISANHKNYCLEIKPKAGFSSGEFRKFSKCFYCVKQLIKLNRKQIKSISSYCPLDFFSGDKIRMKNALLSLINNPQNNFKLFKNDELVYSESIPVKNFFDILETMPPFNNSVNLLMDFVIQILLTTNSNGEIILEENEPLDQVIGKSKCIATGMIPENCFLQNLLKIQTLADNIDIEEEYVSNEDNQYVSEILKQVKNLNINWQDKNQNLSLIAPIHAALISAIASDCSVMISISLEHVEGYASVLIGDHRVSYRIAVTDLEPKPISTLAKRKKREKQLITYYKKYLKNINRNM